MQLINVPYVVTVTRTVHGNKVLCLRLTDATHVVIVVSFDHNNNMYGVVVPGDRCTCMVVAVRTVHSIKVLLLQLTQTELVLLVFIISRCCCCS